MEKDKLIDELSNLKKYLTSEEQRTILSFFLVRSAEYLKTGFPGRLTVDFSSHRINSLHELNFIAGSTQFLYYREKLD